MFGWKKNIKPLSEKPLAKLSSSELRNILEQERLVEDSIKVQKMLLLALSFTMKQLADKHNLPGEFELDRTTGEVFKKGTPV